MKLKDKIAIVTGASNGLGRATAKRLAAQGANDLRETRRTAVGASSGYP